MSDDSLYSIIEDAKQLVKQSANKNGMLKVSPEVAALFEGIVGSTGGADVAAPALVTESPEIVGGTLEELAATVSECMKCDLCKTRTQTVFSDGNGSAGLVFVGEAPGENEDKQGVPFVGRAGELLTDIIVKGMKLRREDVYICNVLKCRPPGNRDPLPEEKDKCEPYLQRQLELIQPKVICALGGHAAKTLLKTEESTGRLRGRWHSYQGIPLRVTYHPAYLLRSPGEKRKTWEDVQEIMKVLNGEITPTP
ncbi:MAG: uracil-DNA glycosylase [Candidatus Hydrogenedentota bacterium]